MLQKTKLFLRNKWTKRIGCFFLAWLIIHLVYIMIDGFTDYKGKADVAIILGNVVFANDSLSPALQGRVDKALLLYKEGRVKKIFASGGGIVEGGSSSPEGDAMRIYLLKHGVPGADIIADNLGQNTFLTAKDFMDWNAANHYSSAIIVSQFYHITRSKYILRKLGFKNVQSVSSQQYNWGDIRGVLREVPAFYKYLLVY